MYTKIKNKTNDSPQIREFFINDSFLAIEKTSSDDAFSLFLFVFFIHYSFMFTIFSNIHQYWEIDTFYKILVQNTYKF